jgi:hypothetical protein
MDNNEFNAGMKEFVDGRISAENRKRRNEDGIRRCEHEIVWMQKRIDELSLKLERKPSVIKEINNLKHQIRHAELMIAFDYSN